MDRAELARYLERECQYPIDRATVIEAFGDVTLESPDDPADDIASILERLAGDERYHSADELYLTLIGTVSDRYIGRKFYDDRGSNPGPPHLVEGSEETASF